MTTLTKSLYTLGLDCPRLLWKKVHQPETLPPFDKIRQFRTSQGNIIGDLARKLYPKGILLPEDKSLYKQNLKLTQEAIKNRQLCFEAGIEHQNLYARADVLIPVEKDQWDIAEVKSSTKIKDKHYHDISFQRHLFQLAGLKIRNCYIITLNTNYEKHGEINPKEILNTTDVTSEVIEISQDIEQRITFLQEIINKKEEPTDINITNLCKNGKKCDCKECYNFLPQQNIFQISRIGVKANKLLEEHITLIKDIPEDFKLSKNQAIQRTCAINNQVHINKQEIKQFVDNLTCPIYYFDFEGFSTAIPMYDGVTPYDDIPFQYSLHIDDGNTVTHKEFLHDSKEDPRRLILDKMKKDLGTSGSIVVYAKTYEVGVLNKLAKQFPEDKEWVESIKKRIVDLMKPFSNFSYYNPKQKGKCSLKDILPILTSKTHSDLNIGEGQLAYITFLDTILTDMSPSEIKQTRKDLLEYCKLDTEAMMLIVNELRELC